MTEVIERASTILHIVIVFLKQTLTVHTWKAKNTGVGLTFKTEMKNDGSGGREKNMDSKEM